MVSKRKRPRIRLALIEKNLEESFVNVDGVALRYVVAGEKDPLLLIHGFGTSLESWWLNVGPLSRHYRVYALDLPGHGLSDRFNVAYNIHNLTGMIGNFMEAVGIERASIIGHSMGGLLTTNIAVDLPEKVDKLILESAIGPGRGIPLRYQLYALPILGEILVLPTTRANVEAGLKKSFYNTDIVTPEMVETSYQFLKLPGAKQAMLNIVRSGKKLRQLYSEKSVLDRLSQIKSPALVIHGAQDRSIPLAHAYETYDLIANSRLKIFDECGHCPHIEKAGEFNKAVIDFLNEESS